MLSDGVKKVRYMDGNWRENKEVAQELKKFWMFYIDNFIYPCLGGYDEQCGEFLFRKTEDVMTCVTKEKKSISECIEIVKKKPPY